MPSQETFVRAKGINLRSFQSAGGDTRMMIRLSAADVSQAIKLIN